MPAWDEATAVQRLQAMYDAASFRKERSIVPQLFGIKYAQDLAGYQVKDLKQIALRATGYASYGGEIYKGIRLARYVKLS